MNVNTVFRRCLSQLLQCLALHWLRWEKTLVPTCRSGHLVIWWVTSFSE